MRTIVVKRPATILLLILTTVTIFLITVDLSGKSYSKIDPVPFEDLRHLAHRLERHPVSTEIMALILVPIVGNVLLFMPWGFLMFLSLYTMDRPTVQTYLLTILVGLTLSLAIEAWQYFLPSRVADVNDVIWNTVGTTVGALLGHLRVRVRFEFE